ncbi:MAG: hypothetical protein AAGC55_12770, partial [Myxococcota bacterium]
TMDLGVNVEFMLSEDGNPAILPILAGLDAESIQVSALNTELLRESSADLETALPTLLNLVLPLIGDALTAIELPEFAGFALSDLGTAKVTTSEDEFAAIYATLAPADSALMNSLIERFPSVAEAIGEPQVAPARARTRAVLRAVDTPDPAVIRAALVGAPGGQVPEIVIDVDRFDQLGRELEYTWTIDGGMWRPFTQAAPLVIRDDALLWQGRHEIAVRARVVGDYRTLDADTVRIPVVIDSAPPRIDSERTRVSAGELVVAARDLVSADAAIEFAVGRPGTSAPGTAWRAGSVAMGELSGLADAGNNVVVYARDELGNTSAETIDLDALGAGDEAGGCSVGGADSTGPAGPIALAGLVLLVLGLGRRNRAGALVRAVVARCDSPTVRGAGRMIGAVVVALGLSTLPGCDCGSNPAGEDIEDLICELDDECADLCSEGSIGLCINGSCQCVDDVPFGRIGRYSELAVSPAGEVWVSAYNERYGDLNVVQWDGQGVIADDAWEFVDGVPEGPVALAGSDRRNGILEAGADVGKYTSVAVGASGEVLVSYFDQDTGSLRMAGNYGGTWKIHTVAEGTPGEAGAPFEVFGQYSSITIGPNNGRPGIAYFAQVSDDSGELRTEVRFASAQVVEPDGPEDWLLYVIDQVAVDGDSADPLTIPVGTGLFIDSVRMSDETPAVVYYDRVAGDLKLARFNIGAGGFNPPELLDGGDGSDVGWYPSIAIAEDDTIHVSYVSASNSDLLYINTADNIPEVIDDGYRVVGTTSDGLPIPEFHRVGDDSSLVLTPSGPVVAYQDATTHELLYATRSGDGGWEFIALAGDESEFVGAYGFYVSAAFDGSQVVVSSWVIDSPQSRAWV